MPMIGFVGMVVFTSWLWKQERFLPNAVGTVEALRADITSGNDGLLLPLAQLANGSWLLFDRVEQDDILARLSDTSVRASLVTMGAELTRIRAEVNAEMARMAMEENQIAIDAARLAQGENSQQFDDRQERLRLTWQVEQHRLSLVDRRVLIEVDRIEQQRLESTLDFWKPLLSSNTITEQAYRDAQLQRDVIIKRINTNILVAKEIKDQLKLSEMRLRDFQTTPSTNPVAPIDGRAILAPLQAAIKVQEAKIDELQIQVKHLVIRAPFTGVITAIFKHPGQVVAAGDPVVSLESEQGQYIVSYLRNANLPPKEGAPVFVKMRALGAKKIVTQIVRVGPQVVAVPPQHLSNPATPEWGTPVRISLPTDLAARPGELINLTLIPMRNQAAVLRNAKSLQ